MFIWDKFYFCMSKHEKNKRKLEKLEKVWFSGNEESTRTILWKTTYVTYSKMGNDSAITFFNYKLTLNVILLFFFLINRTLLQVCYSFGYRMLHHLGWDCISCTQVFKALKERSLCFTILPVYLKFQIFRKWS